MKKMRIRFIYMMSVLWMFLAANIFAAVVSPVGRWQTIDDVTEKPRSIVTISDEDGKLKGYISKVYYKKGEGPDDVCTHCTGDKKDEKILGLNIIWGLVPVEPLVWHDGKILDPENGKIYRCKMQLSEDGQTLFVRGYIGFSLLGRTQTWLRLQ
jgi:uncharacterized protein (DUF2147 family)